MELFKGYIETNEKRAAEKFKNRTEFKTYDQVKELSEFAGILSEDTILIDIDDKKQSDIFYSKIKVLILVKLIPSWELDLLQILR